jgi:FkbM family methyltransferase
LLKRSVEVNRLSDMTLCINAAATDETGKVIFHQPINNSPSCSLLREAMMRPGITDTQSVIVDGIKIDDFIKTTRSAPGLLIKIDTEGADFKVLDGMQQTMTNRVCTIQIEYFPTPMESYTNPIQRLLELAGDYHLLDSGDNAKTILDPTEAGIRAFTEKTKQRPLPATDILMIAKKLPGSIDLRDRIIAG